MKTGANRFFHAGLALCLCLIFSSFAARCQPTVGGITAYSIVIFEGNNVTLDSFDSADPNHSIWQTGMTYHGMPYGVYSDSLSYNSNSLPSRTSDFTVATDGDIISVGNAQIYGFVNTAPGGGIAFNANGSVGDLNWVSSGKSNIEQGHGADDMDLAFYSKSLPNPAANGWQTTWLPVPAAPGGSTNIGGVSYSLLVTNLPANTNLVYYSMGELTQSIFIDASNVVLYLTNGIDLAGAEQFTLNTNADVTIYTSGSVIFTANARITNLTGYARSLTMYDLAGYTNLSFSFVGSAGPALIYAPGSSVLFSSGGTAPNTFIGAIFCDYMSVNGHYAFHYDEALSSGVLPVPPAVIQQPTDQYAQVGSNATFSVVAGGSPTAYQWYFGLNGAGPVNGATNTSLTITNVQMSNGGYYYVQMWYTNGSVASSSPAWLVVYTNATTTLIPYFNVPTGEFQLLVQNESRFGGMPYILEGSTNLTDWVPILTNEAPFVYAETNALPQRYYRAVFSQ